MSLAGLIAATMAFLKDKDIPIEEWVSYIGESFEGSLDDLKDEPLEKVMEHLLTLQILTMGAQVISKEIKPNKVQAVITSIPPKALLEKFGTSPRDLLDDFGLTAKEYETILAMYEAPVSAIGLTLIHAPRNEQEVITLTKE